MSMKEDLEIVLAQAQFDALQREKKLKEQLKEQLNEQLKEKVKEAAEQAAEKAAKQAAIITNQAAEIERLKAKLAAMQK